MNSFFYRIALAAILLLLHAWNCFMVYHAVDLIPLGKGDLSIIIHIFYWAPFVVISFAALLIALSSLQFINKNMPANSLVAMLVICSGALVTIEMILFTILRLGFLGFFALVPAGIGMYFIFKKIRLGQPGLKPLLITSILLVLLAWQLDDDILPLAFFTLLLCSFVVVLALGDKIEPKSKHGIHLLWGWIIAALFVFIAALLFFAGYF